MKTYFLYLSAMLLSAAWLLPFHKTPWTTFGSEVLTFLAAIVFLAALFKQNIKIPKPQLLAFPILLIPFLQFGFGQILYLSNALLCTGYIVLFWLMIIAGYNISLQDGRERVFKSFCFLLIAVGLISSFIAILQWLHLSSYFSPYMNTLNGNRPYANFAQPNNFATFLFMGVIACLYLYEKKLVPNIIVVPIAIIFIFSNTLTQSRTSWVVCLFILMYLAIRKSKIFTRFNFKKACIWVAFFAFMVACLPYINHLIEALSHQEISETSSAIERASSGYLRFDMWSQMLIALSEHPLVGYGWNQTGIAQLAAFDLHPSHEWYKSAHNILFDIIVWNGVPIGGLILLYFACWLYWLHKGIKSIESMIAMLMICPVLIHAMLEFPVHYAYFLLPLGFMLGFIQTEYSKLPSIHFSKIFLSILILIGLVLTAVTYRDYNLYKRQSAIVAIKEPLTIEQQSKMQEQIWLLTQFRERVWWIGLDAHRTMTDLEINQVGEMVANMASKYDLYKYAQLLAFNGKKEEAEHQLWIMAQMHRVDPTPQYADLLQPKAKE